MGSTGSGVLFIAFILILGAVSLIPINDNHAPLLSLTGIAMAQTPDLGTSDNSTDDLGSLPTDNSTDLNSLLEDNSTTVGSSSTGSTSEGTPQSSTSGTTVPEFGSIASMILVISIISIIIISARTRLKFLRF
jgi:predicted secreted protein with PEFG-CTERM motif